MNLITEIEASESHEAILLRHSVYWPRIKAALEAAKEMDEELTSLYDELILPGPGDAVREFRAAMG